MTSMTTATDTTPSGPRAAGIHWDLSPLVADADEARRRLAESLDRCRAFEARYRGAFRDHRPARSGGGARRARRRSTTSCRG